MIAPTPLESSILALASSLAPGVPLDVAAAAVALGRPLNTVRQVVNRMRSRGVLVTSPPPSVPGAPRMTRDNLDVAIRRLIADPRDGVAVDAPALSRRFGVGLQTILNSLDRIAVADKPLPSHPADKPPAERVRSADSAGPQLLAYVATLPSGATLDFVAAAEALGRPESTVRRIAIALRHEGKLKIQAAPRKLKTPRARPVDDRILAAASKHPDGSTLIAVDLARAAACSPPTVADWIKRMKAAGLFRWVVGDGRAFTSKSNAGRGIWTRREPRPEPPKARSAIRAQIDALYPVRPKPVVIRPDLRVSVPRGKMVDLSKCVALHGVGCLNRVDPRVKS
jgi:hypothetical protein